MCGQYRWALSNPRQAKLTLYHCDNATEEERAQVRAAELLFRDKIVYFYLADL